MKQPHLIPIFETGAVASTSLMIPLLASGFASLFEIGLIGADYGLANFISYFLFGRLSDMKGTRRPFIKAGLLVAALAAFLHIYIDSTFSAIIIRAMLGFAVGIYYFPLVAYISAFADYRKRLGGFAGAGALGWSLGTFMAGVLSSAHNAFLAAALLFALGFIVTFTLPTSKQKGLVIPRFPRNIIRKNFRIYAAFLLRHSGAHSVWIIFPLFLQEIGASIFLIGVIYALNTLGQFFIMNWLGRYLQNRNETRFIQTGYILSAGVFVLYYFATNPYQILPVQLVLAAGWSFIWLGSVIHLSSKNEEKATSTGILGSMSGLAQAIGPFLGGAISQAFGFHAVFIFAAAMCLIPFLISRRV